MPYMSVLPATPSGLRLRIGPHELTVDRPPELGGRGCGPSPTELFVGAILACSTDAARAQLSAQGRPEALNEVGCHYDLEGGRVTSIQLSLRLSEELESAAQADLMRAVHGGGLSATPLVPIHLTVAAVTAIAPAP